ncbi:MAG TPA: flavin reductase family protein [Acidimicrobiia bacterium]|nr:flavin reductase family protein [Acidimicrobiia bacterium]
MGDHASEIDQATYRQVCGHFATGVTVITAMAPGDGRGQPVGMAVNSFTSVSIDPPLVLFCAGKSSTTWPSIQAAGAFAVNVLAEDQEAVSRAFASKDGDRFSGIGYRQGTSGSPILNDVLAYIDCTIDAVHDAGDHELVVGRVVDMAVGREVGPLLFFRGGYADIAHH